MREYWKSRLEPYEQQVYNDMLATFSYRHEQVLCGSLEMQDIFCVYNALLCDHPELFYLPNESRVLTRSSLFGRSTELQVQNLYSEAQIRSIQAEFERVRQELLSRVKSGASDTDKELLVCDYLVEHTTYEINNQFNQNAAAAVWAHRAQCSGISKAAKLLLGWLGVDSILVIGDGIDHNGVSGPHAWNIVWIDGKPYHLDVTYMLGANTTKRKPFRHLYLNYSDGQIGTNHRWEAGKVPRCDVWPDAVPEDGRPAAGLGSLLKDGVRSLFGGGGAAKPTPKAEPVKPALKSESAKPTPVKPAPVKPMPVKPAPVEPAPKPEPPQVISSAFKLKADLKAAMVVGKHSFAFTSQLPVSDGELPNTVRNACKVVVEMIGKPISPTVKVTGRNVVITW